MDGFANWLVGILEGVKLLVKSWYGNMYWYMVTEVYKGLYQNTWGHFIGTLLRAPAVMFVDSCVQTKIKGVRAVAILGLAYWGLLFAITRFAFLPQPWDIVALALVLLGFVVDLAVDGDFLLGERRTNSYRGYQVFSMWTIGVPFVFVQTLLIFLLDFISNIPSYLESFFGLLGDILEFRIIGVSIISWLGIGVSGLFIGYLAKDTFHLIDTIQTKGVNPFSLEYANFLVTVWCVGIAITWLIASANDWFGDYFAGLILVISYFLTVFFKAYKFTGVISLSQVVWILGLAALWVCTILVWKMVIQNHNEQNVLVSVGDGTALGSYNIPVKKEFVVTALLKKIRNARTSWR